MSGDGWIKMNERPPEAPEVDGSIEFLAYNANSVRPDIDIVSYDSCSGSFWDRSSNSIDRETITHWMPLPEPPKG